MSTEGINSKKLAIKNYFLYHPDSRVIEVVESGETFNALFDYAFMQGNSNRASVEQLKRVPHLTFYTGDSNLLDHRGSSTVVVDGDTYTVQRVSCDRTAGTYQCEAWLI